MKTIDDIQSEIKSYQKDYPKASLSKEAKRAERRVSFLRKCILYLESSPTESFIRKQLEQCGKIKKSINEEFQYWPDFPDKPMQARKSAYRTERGYKKNNDQITALKFLLS